MTSFSNSSAVPYVMSTSPITSSTSPHSTEHPLSAPSSSMPASSSGSQRFHPLVFINIPPFTQCPADPRRYLMQAYHTFPTPVKQRGSYIGQRFEGLFPSWKARCQKERPVLDGTLFFDFMRRYALFLCKADLLHSYLAALAASISLISSGTTLNRSPTMP